MVAVENLLARSCHLLLLLLLLLLSFPLPSGPMTTAVMTPSGDQDAMEGDRLEINCSLTNQTCNATDMFIRLYRQEDVLTVGEQTTVSQYSVNLVIENASINLSGSYYCYCNNETQISLPLLKYTIGAPPYQPEITGIVLENFKKLVVYFNPVRDQVSLNTNTTWFLTVDAPSGHITAPCEVKRSDANSSAVSGWATQSTCQTSDTFNFIGFPFGVNLTITANNMHGSASTTQRGVKLKEKVELYPVDVELPEINSTWVQLSWTVEKTLEMHYFGGINYQLSFESEFFMPVLLNFTCEVPDVNGYEKCRTIRKVVAGLQPYTDYTLTWRSRPIIEGYWSKNATKLFTTYDDVPKRAPPIQAWQYSYVRKLDNTHLTFIYPQDLPPQDKAGNITEYKYQCAESGRKEGSPRSIEISCEPERPALTVSLWACTKIGCSENASTIILPAAADRLAGPAWLDVEMLSGGRYRLYWQSPQPASLVQLHWCWGSVQLQNQDSQVSVSCVTEISSKDVNGSATNATLSVTATEHPCARDNSCSLQFGVSVDRDGNSSGIIWNTCIFEEGKEPELVSEVTVDSRQAPKEVKLTWRYPCQATPLALRGRPVSYQSRIGRSAGLSIDIAGCDRLQGPDQNSTARHGDISHLYQTDLQEGADYLVCVRPLTSSLHGSAPWKVGQFSTDPKSVELWAVIVGAVLGVVAAVALVSIIFRCSLKRRKNFPITTNLNSNSPSPYSNIAMETDSDIPPSVEMPTLPVSASASPISLQNGSATPQPCSQESSQPIAATTGDPSAESAEDSNANSQLESSASGSDNYLLIVPENHPDENCSPNNPFCKADQPTEVPASNSA